MQIMKHLITTVGEPKMKRGGRAGGEGGAERGADEEDCKTTKAAGERGLARAGGRVGGQGETEPEIKEERMGDEKKKREWRM